MAKYDDMSFGKAFAAARKEKGAGKTFSWRGNSYTTDYKEEKPKGSTSRSSAPSAPPARPTAERESRGPSTRARRPAAEVAAAERSARSALSQARETMRSGPTTRPTTNRDEKLEAATRRIDTLLKEETPDDPKTYIDNLQRFTKRIRDLLGKGGLSEREDKFRGLGAEGQMFEGISRRENSSGTTGSRARAGMAKGGMAKKGYAKGGMIKANCGASMKPNRKAKK